MDLSFFSAPILTIAGLLVLAWEASTKKRNALVSLGGLALIATGFIARFVGDGGVAITAARVVSDVGIGLLAGSLLLMIRRTAAWPFLTLGLALLSASALIRLLLSLLGFRGPLPAAYTELLVELGPDDRIEEVAPMLDASLAHAERAFPTVSLELSEDLAQVFIVRVPRRRAERLGNALRADFENVDAVEPNAAVTLFPPVTGRRATFAPSGSATANDPLIDSQWAIGAVNGHQAHRLLASATPSRKAVLAILDSGVDAAHEDLESVFSESPAPTDEHGHGTHCAGIAAAVTNNGRGIASFNWEGRYIDLKAYAAVSPLGIGTVESVAQGIIDATTDGADVISISLGLRTLLPPKTLMDVVDFAHRRDVIIVAAAGNARGDAARSAPANLEGVISVAAVDENLQKASFTNTNTSLTRPLSAPGVGIISSLPGLKYDLRSGTSMATPLVAGLIATMRAVNPSLTSAEAYDILSRTGRHIDDTIGPMIDAEAALRAVGLGD